MKTSVKSFSLFSILSVLFCLVTMVGMTVAEESQPVRKDDMISQLVKKYGTEHSVADLTPTVCSLWNIQPPKKCSAIPVAPVLKLAKERLQGKPLEKTLIFCPDAIGTILLEKYPDDFAALVKETDYIAKSTNVMPSVTPVCFGSIFTGAPPEVHGIVVYSKPVIAIPTLFDVFTKARKKVAIIAVNHCSIDCIFRQRKIDYYSFTSDEASFQFTKHLLNHFDYDLIISYDGGYDSTMHGKGVDAKESLDAMRDSIRRYGELVAECDKVWKGKKYLTVFAPDHGSHDAENGKGTHGKDRPEDILVNHYYRLRSK